MELPRLPEELLATLPPAVVAYITALEAHIETLTAQVAELQARLNQNSRNSSRPPSSDPPWQRDKPKPPQGKRRPGGQPGHPGHHRSLLPEGQVDRIIRLVPEQCEACGEPLAAAAGANDPADLRHQVTELPELSATITEYQQAARRCRGCGHVTRARRPAGVGDETFGPRLQAVVALLSGRYRVSRREVVALLADLWGVEVGLGTVVRLEQATSAALASVVDEAEAAVQHEPMANLDETGWWQGRQRAWLWTVVTASLTVFRIAPKRAGQVARELLGPDWRGIVGSDRFSGYAWLRVCWRQLCWAHLKRDFQKLVDQGGTAAPVGTSALAVERQVFVLWHRFRAGALDRASLQRELEPLQGELWRILAAGERDHVAGVCSRLLNLWPALWTFARVPDVEPTNNAAEQALRPAVLWRKGSFGTHSDEGSRFAERMLTVAATCRQQGRNLLDLLLATNQAARLGAPPPSLLPAQLAGC